MATALWVSNAPLVAQVETVTISATANGAVFTATIANKAISYMSSGSETTSSAAANFQALLSAKTAPAEFLELTFTVTNNAITIVNDTIGTPFTISFVGVSGGTLTQVHTTANGSPSDVTNSNNWLRNGAYALPQSGDDIVIQGTNAAALLWNLASLNITPNSFTRWQSFEQTIGLPDWNPLGYLEYRPKYLLFGGGSSSASPSGTAINFILGVGNVGTGPGRERYNLSNIKTNFVLLAGGAALDDNEVTLQGTNSGNTIKVQSTSCGTAMGVGEAAALSSATVDGGGTLNLGAGCAMNGPITVNSAGTLGLYTTPTSLLLQNSAQATVFQDGMTIPTVSAQNGSTLTYLCGGTISNFTLSTGSRLDKSQDLRTLTITTASVDGDTAQVNDPNSVIVWPNGALVNGQVTSGPFLTGPGRQWKIT